MIRFVPKKNNEASFAPTRLVWQEKSPDNATTELAKEATELVQLEYELEEAKEGEKRELEAKKEALIIKIGKELERNGRNVKSELLYNLSTTNIPEYIRRGVAISFDSRADDNGKKILSMLLKDNAFIWHALAQNDTVNGETLRKMAMDPDKGGVGLKQQILRNPNCPADLKKEILEEFEQRRNSKSRG